MSNSAASHLLRHLQFLCYSGELGRALTLFRHPNQISDSIQAYALFFHACALHRFLPPGISLHRHLLRRRSSAVLRHLYVQNHLLNMYSKCGDMEQAHHLFDEMPHKNSFSWTILLSGYAQNNLPDHCFSLFLLMLSHLPPQEFALSTVLTSCSCHGRHLRGLQLHALSFKTSFDSYEVVSNSLISMYCRSSRVGCGSRNAWDIFKSMDFKSLITWNSMISGLHSLGEDASSVRLFSAMMREGVRFDRATLLSLLSSTAGVDGGGGGGGGGGGVVLLQIHCLCLKAGLKSEVEVATSLVKAYMKLLGEKEECYMLFLENDSGRDVVQWTGIMNVFSEEDPSGVFFFFCQMRRHGFSPDCYVFSSVLKAAAGFSTERHARVVHGQVVNGGFGEAVVIQNGLINAYGRCGCIGYAEEVFGEMSNRGDVVSWNTILKVEAIHGRGREAVGILSGMEIEPDATTFVSVLAACGHAGMVEEGVEVFRKMVEVYHISPMPDHISCLVDLLGRSGRVGDAEEVLKRVHGFEDSVMWGALLGACRKHGEGRVGEVAAAKIAQLDPGASKGYVQVYNMYCSSGRFARAGEVREEMEGVGVKKDPGLSWIEVGNVVEEFASGGLFHPRREVLWEWLHGLDSQLKDR